MNTVHAACMQHACMMHRDCLLRRRRRVHTRILVRAMRAAITTRRQGARNDPCFAMINVNCFIPQKGNSNQVSRLEWDKKSLRMQVRSFRLSMLFPVDQGNHQVHNIWNPLLNLHKEDGWQWLHFLLPEANAPWFMIMMGQFGPHSRPPPTSGDDIHKSH